MRRISLNKKLVLASIASVLIGTIGTISVMAAIPDTNGIIHGCYKKSDGSLRIINSPSRACNTNETATSWSSQTKGNVLIDNLHDTDLTEVHLEYLNLSGVSFQNSDFNQTYLVGSDLTNANFSGAAAGDLRIRRARADGVNFSNATNVGIYAEGASIKNSNFSSATVTTINGGDFTGAHFRNITLNGALDTVNFTNVDFRGSTILGTSSITSSNLTNANFRGLSITNAAQSFSFNYDNLTNANFSNANFDALYSVSFGAVNTTHTNFSGAHFHNVVFDQTDLSTANLSNTTWSNVFCPDRTYSDAHGNTCIGHTNVVMQ